MTHNVGYCFIATILVSLFFCGPAHSLEMTQPEKEYRNILVLENNTVYGVTDQTTKDGKYIPKELTGEEKVKVVLFKFTMKDDVDMDVLKSDKLQKAIIKILAIEKKASVKLLREWLKDKNPRNREKAAYLLKEVGEKSR
jgi:hypothetical protein